MGIKVKGSTILEPVLAVAILSFGLTIGGISLSNIFNNSYDILELEARNTIPLVQKEEGELEFSRGKVYSYDLFEIEVAYEKTSYTGVRLQKVIATTKNGKELFQKKYYLSE